MFLINADLFNKLPEEAKGLVEAEGTAVDNEDTIKQIESLAGAVGEDESQMMTYGNEGEYEDELDEEGGIKDLPESKKNGIKDFDQAAERGQSLIEAMHKVNPIKKKKVGDDDEVETKKDEEQIVLE